MAGRRNNNSTTGVVNNSNISSQPSGTAAATINGDGGASQWSTSTASLPTTTASTTGGTSRQQQQRGRQRQKDDSFHPKLITLQIVAMQCFHYFFLSFLFQINYVVYNKSITIDRIFTDQYVRIWRTSGWADVSAIILASLAGAVLLAIIVEKSKKCLDFSVTLFLVHLFLSTLYGGFPKILDWWIVHVLGTIIMVVLGEYLCSRKEMEEIPLLQL